MHGATGPGAAEVGSDFLMVQELGNFAFRTMFIHEEAVDAPDGRHLVRRPRHEDDAIGLKAFPLSAVQFSLRVAVLVDQSTPKPGAPPCRNPSSIRRHCPMKTLTDSSRLCSPAMARLRPLIMVATGLPSFSNCSAQ